MIQRQFYLQFGTGNEPRQTINVPHKVEELWYHKRGLMQTATGYGAKLRTMYKIKWQNRWYRVYLRQYSNVGTCYIISQGQEIIVDATGSGGVQ